MSLTYSAVNNDNARYPLGSKRFFTIRDIVGDTSNPSGGYSITPQAVGLQSRIDGARMIGLNAALPAGVGDVQWDQANQKLLILAGQIPPFIPKEVMSVTSHAGRLAYVPGYIIAAAAIAGGTTGPLRIIPVGETPATGQVAINLVTGACVFAAADAVTSAVFTYIPLGVGPFIEANRVVDESNTGTNDTTRDLANRAALIQYVWNDTAGTLPTLIPVGEAPASGEAAIDINNAGATTITVNAAQDDATYKITYWKFSALGVDDFAWADQADITIASTSLFAFADDLAVPPNGIWIPGFGNVLVGEATATNKQAVLVPPGVAGGANIAVYYPTAGKITLTAGDGYTTIEVPSILLNPGVVQPNGGEAPAGTRLTGLSVRMMFIGQ
jgi:hypothetical protein